MHAATIFALLLSAAACDSGDSNDGPLIEGQQLDATTYSEPPASRQGYATMAAFASRDGRVYVLDPGTGPADPPRKVRSFAMPGLLSHAVQVDSDGYLWVATPDLDSQSGAGSPHDRAYVVDPHSGTVHRVVTLPRELRAVADLTIGTERVYVRAWRDGFSGGIGVIPRTCVSDPAQCVATLLVELGNVGLTPQRALHLSGQFLYSFSGPNSRDRRRSVDKIDLSTGEIASSSNLSSNFTFDDMYFYTVDQFTPGRNEVVRLVRETLEESRRFISAGSVVAVQPPYIYLSTYQGDTIEVHSAETLEPIQTFDVSAAGGVSASFGFVAPDVLMLNGNVSLDVSTGALLRDPAQVDFGALQLAVRLPEGHPLAY